MGRERTRGFTLIELLVVIAIISLLITIVTTVGAAALAGGRARQTQDTIRAVDAAVTTYLNDVGTVPPAFVPAFAAQVSFNGSEPPQPTRESFAAYPLLDGVDLTNGEEDRARINSIGLFMQALDEAGLGETLASVPAESLTRWDGDADLVNETASFSGDPGNQPEMRTILDGWGRPLRFVHPSWDGPVTEEDNMGNARAVGSPGTPVDAIWSQGGAPAPGATNYWLEPGRAPLGYDPTVPADFPIMTVRRNFLTDQDREAWAGTGEPIGDSDGGYTIGNVPYIYSAGEDGDPSTLKGNVYTTEPRRPVVAPAN